MVVRALAVLPALLQLLDLVLLNGDLPEAAIDFPKGFSLFPNLADPSALPLRLQATQANTLLIEPNSLLLPALVLEIDQVLVESLNVLPLLRVVLLYHLLHLLHLLVEHLEQLSILLVLNLLAPKLHFQSLNLCSQRFVLAAQVLPARCLGAPLRGAAIRMF